MKWGFDIFFKEGAKGFGSRFGGQHLQGIHQLTEIGFQIGTYERKPSSRLKPKSMSKIIKMIQKTWEKWASIFSCNANKNNVVLTIFS